MISLCCLRCHMCVYVCVCVCTFRVSKTSTAVFTAGFDNVGTSMLTDFQCLTLTSWGYIMYRTMHNTSPFSILYFFTLVMFGAYFLVRMAATAAHGNSFSPGLQCHYCVGSSPHHMPQWVPPAPPS